jgi:hypothetical protein
MNKNVYILIAVVIFLWIAAYAFLQLSVNRMNPPKEKFVVDQRLTRVPTMRNEETHDVLAYSLGYK